MENLFPDLDNLPKGFISEKKAAEYLQMSISGLRKYRYKNLIGYIRAARKVFYTAGHIREFCEIHKINPLKGIEQDKLKLTVLLVQGSWFFDLLPFCAC